MQSKLNQVLGQKTKILGRMGQMLSKLGHMRAIDFGDFVSQMMEQIFSSEFAKLTSLKGNGTRAEWNEARPNIGIVF